MGNTVTLQVTAQSTLRTELIRKMLAAILFSMFCVPSSYVICKQ
jgi:hypothetical protein